MPLDQHTVSNPLPSVIDAMLPYLREHWRGASLSAQPILDALGAAPRDRFHFFHSSEEAIQSVFLSHYVDSIRETGRNHILTTAIEETPVFSALKRLEELGCHGKVLPVNEQGQLTKSALENALGPRVSLVTISWANGLTGVIHPIADLAEACKAKDVRLHVDASYVIGKQFFRFEDMGIDYLTFEGSLVHSLPGTAGLIVKKGIPFSSYTTPPGGIAALTQALEENAEMFDHMCLEIARLRDKLEKGVQAGVPDAQVLFQNVERLPNCTAIAFPDVVGEALQFLLSRKNIHASVGGGRSQKLSQILLASGIEESLAHSALSFSLSFQTGEEEIDRAIELIVESVQKLKNLSEQVL